MIHRLRGRTSIVRRGLLALMLPAVAAMAQLTDVTQTPNLANEGIKKSFLEQIGAGRGNVMTPDSSIFIIRRDPFRSIRRGRQIFQRKFTVAQGLGPRTDDGVGNIETDASHGAGLSDSCASCHGRPRGSAGFGGDVFTRPDSRDAPHLFGLGLQEMLADEITHDLRSIRSAAIAAAQQSGQPQTRALVSKGISYGTVRAMPDGSVDKSMIRGVNDDLRVRPFFAQGGTISIREFLVGAFNAEMGLESPDPDLLAASAGADVITPSGMVLSGSIDRIEAPPASSPTDDPDHDGVVNEIPTSVVDHMEFYLLNYFKPGTGNQANVHVIGRQLFSQIGCASCHIPDLQIEHDRRVADVETVYDPVNGNFNQLFATATPRFSAFDDGSGFPSLKTPSLQPFLVRNIFTDFKRHDLGPNFHERNFDGTTTTMFITEPLWGVGSTAPYGHDGRSIDLHDVILRHGGEAQAARDAFAALNLKNQYQVLIFLESLVLFPPDDTASNLNPGDRNAAGFPQNGHGSIRLPALFNNPNDPE
ncbi:MAG: thiol oxidoreductase-like protein [Planctomycetes bacterium]|nr:thiol oxidoreductase-like protein [Planctomycetota bacterium]MBI3848421.1 thiol oxidoreductase-like protein [Planctomycetota bacterium]